MTASLVRPLNGSPRELATLSDRSPIATFKPLDVYAGGISDEAPRLDCLATISAGYRSKAQDGKPGMPQRSTDGTIYLHDATGRAPALAAALKASDYKRLTIAFPTDDPNDFIQQRFANYSASSLLAYGDKRSITVVNEGKRETFDAGTEGYKKAVASCKVSVSVYFMLAEWTADGPAVALGDGFGYYRLRFTSRNSLRNLVASLTDVSRFTRGHIAGLPFEMSIDYREVSDPKGAKRTVPVWTFVPRPPNGIRLTSRNFREIAGASLAEGQALMLPAPAMETLDAALADGPDPDMDHIQILERGGRCDKDNYLAQWHATVRGTRYEDADERAEFINEWTQGRYASLAKFLESATESEASGLITAIKATLAGPEIVEGVVSDQALEYPNDDALVYWLDLRADAVELGIDVKKYQIWGDERPTLVQLKDAYKALRTAVKGHQKTAQPSDSQSQPETSDEKRKGLFNELAMLRSRAPALGVDAGEKPSDAIDTDSLNEWVRDLRERCDVAAAQQTDAQRTRRATAQPLDLA